MARAVMQPAGRMVCQMRVNLWLFQISARSIKSFIWRTRQFITPNSQKDFRLNSEGHVNVTLFQAPWILGSSGLD